MPGFLDDLDYPVTKGTYFNGLYGFIGDEETNTQRQIAPSVVGASCRCQAQLSVPVVGARHH